jgi:hypothetical protein
VQDSEAELRMPAQKVHVFQIALVSPRRKLQRTL